MFYEKTEAIAATAINTKTKAIVKRPVNPIPELELLLFDIFFSFIILQHRL